MSGRRHLSRADIEQIGIELDAIRQDVLDSRGASDAAYIRRMVKTQRYLELGSRAVLLGSIFPPAFIAGHGGAVAGQDPRQHGDRPQHPARPVGLDARPQDPLDDLGVGHGVSPAEQWKHAHNDLHHTYTNVIGKDNDLGYGIMRVDEDQTWHPRYLAQPFWNFLNALIFEYGIAMYDVEIGEKIRGRGLKQALADDPKFREDVDLLLAKIKKQAGKDYVVHPLLSLVTGSFLTTLAANVIANVTRNVWSHSVIMCGHFPEGVETFERASIEGETKGDWYVRQMLGSANISGSKFMHTMTGNLSHQIEHHLFPDLPSNRYAEVAPKVQALFDKYDLAYCSRPLVPQVASAWHRVFRLSLPNGWLEQTNRTNVVSQVKKLWKLSRSDYRTRRKMLREMDRAAGRLESDRIAA
jgi:fatty acid desaturase